MGVRSLLSFMSNSNEFFKDCSYSNGYLVIDGINLVYVLHNKCPRKNCCFGGEYQAFYDFVVQFFSVLRSCGIKPVVVLDGAADRSKAMTQWRRARDQAAKAIICDPSNQHEVIVKPVFAVWIFIEAVKTFDNAVIFHSLYEADGYLARIARRLDCPVLSNDSDFFIFDVRYITLNSVDWASSTEGSLLCEEFDRDKFLDRFAMNDKPDMLPLLAVLMGNDYVNPRTFDRIFEQIHLPKKKYLSPRHRKMTGLLRWLSREDAVKDALDRLMNAIPLDHREQTRAKVVSGIAMYALDINMCSSTLEEAIEEIRLVDHSILPVEMCQELADAYHNCDALLLSQIVLNRSVILSTQVECPDQQSARLFALPLTKEYCRLIFTRQNMLADEQSTSVEVKVILRQGRGIIPVTICLDQPLNLENECERRDHLVGILRAEKVMKCEEVEEKEKFLLTCMCYWRHCQPEAPSAIQILALVLCIKIWESGDGLKEKVKRFKIVDKSSKAVKNFDRQLVHSFSNLQAVMYQAVFVNNLLGKPFPQLNILFWSGTILYNLCQEFPSCQDALKYFEFDSVFHSEVSLQFNLWCQLLDIDTSGAVKDRPTKKRNGRKQRKVKDNIEKDPNVSSHDEDKVIDLHEHDINNRFALLAL